jgi:hypothetical protein
MVTGGTSDAPKRPGIPNGATASIRGLRGIQVAPWTAGGASDTGSYSTALRIPSDATGDTQWHSGIRIPGDLSDAE